MSEQVTQPGHAPEAIRTSRLVPVHTFKMGPISALFCILFLFTVIGIPIAMGISNGARLASRARNRYRAVQEGSAAFRAFIGSEPEHLSITSTAVNNSIDQISATAIAVANGRLFVMEGGIAAEIPWKRIRSWAWNIEGHDVYTGNAAAGTHLRAGQMTQDSRDLAASRSGFVITVRDVEKPEWRFACAEEMTLKKWMEILSQMASGDMPRR